jgi:hypothetical protein
MASPPVDVLAAAVGRAAAAGIPVAVIELLAAGAPFTPPRGPVGARYAASEISVRALSAWGAGALDGGLSLYPAPEPETRRVILLLLEERNWLPHDDALERMVAGAVAGVR